MKEFLSLFYTHSGAIKFQRAIEGKGMSGELMPVPRKLSSNCGIGCRFSYEEPIENLISEEIEKIFEIKDKEYIMVYEEEE
ncbi:Protein of unknown function [Clostridium collagenovorans DSM 3089]|uniref:Putative Se/S carrier protein-like domain-containing protein n=1 Tax=Clostridium collagenovorans DSM 3089 TaxID=1121306 RepID=A0A1M5S8U5_9CLOT|nr:DUF3343 domain-containing protein [Clostridium collagenovorans]SHH34916.1 Protein of unknown function [Clostridium collagenovorans DSM 3089]